MFIDAKTKAISIAAHELGGGVDLTDWRIVSHSKHTITIAFHFMDEHGGTIEVWIEGNLETGTIREI